ncbi:hypothetical protein PBY51_010743 [Eleginops maclovinus]|uniref:C2H2-type domain-containing protein n=1 Tax=Eleginops maclovinus TaxID=56733 RepID=A0AAN8AJT7_ELEMC|nr:hypothetical protein PBY51_010743 [Eleginops maclovinus]
MAESNVESEQDWIDRALDTADDTLVAMETLLATLRAFEDVLRQQELSIASSTEYCDNFCQALMHYAGSRNSMEHGLPLLEVYCLSISCFAAARSHLTAESDRVALVLKRLALSCFELLLSVPENEIPYEAWVQFHHSVQIAHDTLLQYGSTDLQALLQITGEGGAWSNAVLTSLLTGLPTNPDEVNAYISLEGEGFLEMRVKHLEKMGEVAKAVVLAKACTECSSISNQATFRQTFVSLLCHLLPNEEAIMEISRLDCKDVLEITCTLESEGEENTAFILCTTFLTQQLQQQSLYCSWELTLLWSKLQRKIDPSSMSLLERCLQLGAIAQTVLHLLCLVRVIQTETQEMGIPASVELCVKALQLPKQDDSETRISVCKSVSCLLPGDLEVLRACLLTEFLLGPSPEVFGSLKELYLRPDQKYDQENEVIPNSLRCELLLALKAYWPFDPEFWDWKTLKYHCISLLGLRPESDGEEEEATDNRGKSKQPEPQGVAVKVESEHQKIIGIVDGDEQQDDKQFSDAPEIKEESASKKHKFCCKICKRSFTDTQIIHHSKKHGERNRHPCPMCLEKFKSRKDLVPHLKEHLQSKANVNKDNVKTEAEQKRMEEDDDIEPGEITIDPSLMQYYKSTHDPEVLQHIVQQAKSVKEKNMDDDEYVTFEYIDEHFNLQNRDEYPCPGTGCTRIFKHSKYLYVHLKLEHRGDDNVKHFNQMRDKREKCVFCRRHLASAHHHRKHRRVHYGDRPYMCVVMGCGAKFRTSIELVTHKQTHGFHLNYQCELKGCYVTYSDLGQIYHHEAQHFRDAAFTCSSPECSKYYLSKKEFIKHLSTHNITFSERDFEAQRKARRKLLKTLTTEASNRLNKSSDPAETDNGDVLNSSSTSCASSLQSSDGKEPKTTMTLVAVCFDGSKFTCGFEKCGMTFSRARDVQRHLKCAHPEHLKLENKEHKHDKDRGSKSKGMKTETEPDSEEKGKGELSTPFQPMKADTEKKEDTEPQNNETNSSSFQTNTDDLSEVLMGLSKLDLNSLPPHSVPTEPPQSNPESNTSHTSLHQAIMAKPPVVLLRKRALQVPDENLLLEKDFESHHRQEVRKEPAKKRHLPNLDEPQPQYKCHFANCYASYHLKSSLVRHTRDFHSQPPEPIRCKFEGCTRVFSHDDALKKHTLYSHCEYYDSLVVRLQSTHKKSITGCQKKLIVAPQSPQKEESGSTASQAEGSSSEPDGTMQSEEAVVDKEKSASKQKMYRFSHSVFRSHEEALQMCQDRGLRKAYPCMMQGCDSIVTYSKSLHRHYLRVHRMCREDVYKNEDKLVNNAEQLEELIQRKSARPTVTETCSPNGVRKMEYQAEPENTGGQPAPMSLHSIKADAQEEDNDNPMGFPEEEEEEPPPVERNGVLVGADEVLYGEPSTGGHTEGSAASAQNSQKQEERLSLDKIKPLLRSLTVDLSPPCSLRITAEDGLQDSSGSKDGGKLVNGAALLAAFPVRQPLKRKNELSEPPLNLKETQPHGPSPLPFDITAYKPIGFESSFLRFIQDTTPKDKNVSAPKRRDSFRRGCSVKENNQLGISHTRRRTHSPMLKPHTITGDFTPVQNLKSILDKALAGCGDLAIKQLQYLRPVVVLGRPVCSTTLPYIFPSDTNNSELLLGS